MGTDKCVMAIKDEYDRILITHEADSENSKEANAFLNKLKYLGLNKRAVKVQARTQTQNPA